MKWCEWKLLSPGVCVCESCGSTLRHDKPEECRGVCVPGRRLNAGAPYILDRTPEGNYLWACRNCDWTHETETDEPIEHRCGRKEVVRLGDRIAAGLESIGVTKEAWAEFTTGSPVPCGGCSKRQAWLNQVDEKFGLGEKVESLKSLLGWVK